MAIESRALEGALVAITAVLAAEALRPELDLLWQTLRLLLGN